MGELRPRRGSRRQRSHLRRRATLMPAPCADRVCSKAKKSNQAFMQAMGNVGKSSTSPKEPCPLDREELGRSTWDFLHTTAAYYPETPTESQKKDALALITSLSNLYACGHCAEDLRESLKSEPAQVGSREEFATWMCRMHNTVNIKLGKPAMPCDFPSLDRRWRTGCDSSADGL